MQRNQVKVKYIKVNLIEEKPGQNTLFRGRLPS